MPRTIATNTAVDRDGLTEFLRPRHHMILLTWRQDGVRYYAVSDVEADQLGQFAKLVAR